MLARCIGDDAMKCERAGTEKLSGSVVDAALDLVPPYFIVAILSSAAIGRRESHCIEGG